MKKEKSFAEVIQSSLSGFMAQSWEWNTHPAFGSLLLVQTKKRTLFGLVHQIETGSLEANRYPFAYQKTHEELMAEQPQIFEFLQTNFSCIIAGYQEKGSIKYLLAPEPAPIHAFVAHAPQAICKQFFASHKYLHLLFGQASHITNFDELLLAVLAQQQQLGILKIEKITDFAHTFSLLTGNDYRRLKLFLQRAQQLI